MKYRSIHIFFTVALCLMCSTHLIAATIRYIPLRYKVTGISDDAIKKNVNVVLQNYHNTLHFPLTQSEIRHFIKKAPHLIQTAVEPYGYFRSQVQTTLTQTARTQTAQLHVLLGPALPIASIHVRVRGEGKNDPEFKHLIKHLPFRVGQTLQTDQYDLLKEKLYNVADARGYFQAKMIKSEIKINLKAYHASIVVIFDSGKRFRFGPTTFSKTPFHDKFLKRFLLYKEGDYFNGKKVAHTQEDMVTSSYFVQVIPKPELNKIQNGYVPVHFSLIMRKKKAYTYGLGYGTDTGIRGTIGWALRYIGHSGHRFHTLLRASEDNSSVTAKYIIPGSRPARDLFTIGAGAAQIRQSSGAARNAKFALTYALLKRHWKSSLTLAYLNERYNITGLPITSTELVYPTFETKYSKINHPRHPEDGIKINLALTGASRDILSETNFFQSTLHMNLLYTLRETNTRFLFRTDLGHTSITNLVRLPLSLQLFAGGARSVRGYAYNSIGPGRNLVVGSTEIQQKVIGSLYLAGFIDAGVVGDQNTFQHINAGAGPGIAWVSNIGTIEFTVAQAFTRPNKPWMIQFTMGTTI